MSFGTGMIVPFAIIYLHNVRGFSLSSAGAIDATFAGVSLLGTFIGGSIGDKYSIRLSIYLSLLIGALGYGLFAFANTLPLAFLAMGIAGLGNGLYWPMQSALMSSLAGVEKRDAAFALRQSFLCAAIGLGSIAGGLIAVVSKPHTFVLMFLITSFCLLLSLIVLIWVRIPKKTLSLHKSETGSWKALLNQHTILAIAGLNMLCFAGSYAVFQTALPVFAFNSIGLSNKIIGLIFFVNAAAVPLLQMPFVRLSRNRSRMKTFAVMSALWSILWLGIWFSSSLRGQTIIALFLVVGLIFALGECVIPLLDALVANLAPGNLQARSLGLITAARGLGFMIGQIVLGFVLQYALTYVWFIGIGSLLIVAIGALYLERRIPKRYRLIS